MVRRDGLCTRRQTDCRIAKRWMTGCSGLGLFMCFLLSVFGFSVLQKAIDGEADELTEFALLDEGEFL